MQISLPSLKRGTSADPKNYRPVSLTSLFAKSLEHIISKQICSHLSGNSVISQHQLGFQRGFSCETQLIMVIHEWASVLNIYGQVDAIFLDSAKAFDSMPYGRLLLKAKFYGISGNLTNWLRAFLTGRRQRVVVNGASSKWAPDHLVPPRALQSGANFVPSLYKRSSLVCIIKWQVILGRQCALSPYWAFSWPR